MLRRGIPKPTPSMVVALAALFVALGGSSIAASTLISGSKIKKNSIPGNRIKKASINGDRLVGDSVTGTQVNEATLGKVPAATKADTAGSAASATNATKATTADTATKATTADSATSATNAVNAQNVDGMDLSSFAVNLTNGQNDRPILTNFDGLTLTGSCTSGANQGLTLKASTAEPGGFIAYSAVARNNAANGGNDSVGLGTTPVTITSPGGTVDTGNGATDVGYSMGTFVFHSSSGARVSVVWEYTGDVQGYTCGFGGTVTARPPGAGPTSRSAAPRHAPAGSTAEIAAGR